MIAIKVNNLIKSYNELFAVNNVSLEVKKGEVFGLLGPNGAGKTTTIESIAGLRSYNSGSISILGKKLDDYKDKLYHTIGVQLQETIYQDHIKVFEICELFVSFYDEHMDYKKLLTRFHLDSKLKSYVSKLSGGQRQKLSVILALIGNPKVVLLDELTTGLDPEARRDIWEFIKDLKTDGITVFMSTHYMEEAAELCDKIAIINNGKIIATGSVNEVIMQSELRTEITFSVTSNWKLSDFIDKIKNVEVKDEFGYITVLTDDDSTLMDIMLYLNKEACTYKNMNIKRPTLDEAYLVLIGGSHE